MLIGDSAFPPATYPTEFQGEPVVGWCVYLPGGDAYHGWSQAEIEALKAQPWCQYVVPVFVRSNPQGAAQAEQDAATVIAWSKAQGQPNGTLVMWDYETAVDSAYELTVSQQLAAGDGDLETLYGSKSTVIENTAPSGGYDEADWTGTDSAPASMAAQFYSGAAYDLNDFRATAPLWRIRGSTPTTTTAPSAPTPRKDEIVTVQSVDGVAIVGWSSGEVHDVEVITDESISAFPTVRVALQSPGANGYVLNAAWAVSRTDHTLEIPAQFVPDAFGVVLKAVDADGNAVTDVRYGVFVS
jgi:hypothetical protein